MRILYSLSLLLLLSPFINAQLPEGTFGLSFRSGTEAYWKSNESGKTIFQTWYNDIGLTYQTDFTQNVNAAADLTYRFGSEYGNSVNYLRINEAWAGVRMGRVEISAGKRVFKWGSNLISSDNHILNPQDFLYPTPMPEEGDLGVIFVSGVFRPVPGLSIELLLSPLFSPSIIPVSSSLLPDYVLLTPLKEYNHGPGLTSFGLKLGSAGKGIDWGVVLFHGPEPMTLMEVDYATLDTTGGSISPAVGLSLKPSPVTSVGGDIEILAGNSILRIEGSYINPSGGYSSKRGLFPELSITAGVEYSLGQLTVSGEYGFKHLFNFVEPLSEPVIPNDIGYIPPAYIPAAMAGFRSLTEISVTSFGRLYRYQLNENYHTLTTLVSLDLARSSISSILAVNYNITTSELLLKPALKYNISDGVTLFLGVNLYTGKEKSLFSLIEETLSAAYFSFRIDI